MDREQLCKSILGSLMLHGQWPLFKRILNVKDISLWFSVDRNGEWDWHCNKPQYVSNTWTSNHSQAKRGHLYQALYRNAITVNFRILTEAFPTINNNEPIKVSTRELRYYLKDVL